MGFDPSQYGTEVQAILALDGDGRRPMPLANGARVEAGIHAVTKHSAHELFPGAFSPDAARSGLYLYFCGYDESHEISQNISTVEGSFWHGIMHRQEPDAGNAEYWFRRVGEHAVFPALRDRAQELDFPVKDRWDPFAFIEFCERARHKPGSKEEELAMAVQLAEWQLLFDYCARAKR
jgi:hypothetical protein